MDTIEADGVRLIFHSCIILADSSTVAPAVQGQLAGIRGLDEKVLLHIINSSAIPQFLLSSNV